MRLGAGSKFYWILSAAYSFVRGKVLPNERYDQERESVGRLTNLYYRTLSSQVDSDQYGVIKQHQ